MVRKKVTRKVTKRTAAPARSGVAPQGRRFDNAQKQHALVLVASGMRRVEVAATIGTTTESLRRWVTEATTAGTMPAPPHALLLLDDFSRFIVGHALTDSPSSAVVTATFRSAMARHGKPEASRTDRGGAFVAFTKDGDFGRVLEAELVDHIVGRSYSPRGGGKVESAIGTLKRELWECFQFEDRAEAERRLSAFVEDYNHRRAHMGIDGLVPADRFFGRAGQVLARIDALSRGRIAALAARNGGSATPVEETISAILDHLAPAATDGACPASRRRR